MADEYPHIEIEDGGDRLQAVLDPTLSIGRFSIANGVNRDGSIVGPRAEMLLDRDEMRRLFNWLGIQLHKL